VEAEVVRHETLEAVRVEGYRTTFTRGRPCLETGDALPAGWEGLYFPFSSPLEGLRPDGTPADDLIPDTGLPRRMYAGEDTVFHEPLRVGDRVERRERLDRVVEKTGASGRLVFADIVREFRVDGRLAVQTTWHDVFLGETSTARRPTAFEQPSDGWADEIVLDARQLFRFSALTFNTHRVHYDREWATGVEGLPVLLVHGPLTRMLLLDAVTSRRDGALPATFSFVAMAPLWVDQHITIAGHEPDDTTTEVLAVDDSGHIAAKGTAVWSAVAPGAEERTQQ
jgi:3-methylfumaryl-CoA hydratase